MGGGEYSEGEGEGDGEGYGGERVEGVSERKRGERGGRGEMIGIENRERRLEKDWQQCCRQTTPPSPVVGPVPSPASLFLESPTLSHFFSLFLSIFIDLSLSLFLSLSPFPPLSLLSLLSVAGWSAGAWHGCRNVRRFDSGGGGGGGGCCCCCCGTDPATHC